jgi:hypothetical protein
MAINAECCYAEPIMLSVIKLNVVKLIVVAPLKKALTFTHKYQVWL